MGAAITIDESVGADELTNDVGRTMRDDDSVAAAPDESDSELPALLRNLSEAESVQYLEVARAELGIEIDEGADGLLRGADADTIGVRLMQSPWN